MSQPNPHSLPIRLPSKAGPIIQYLRSLHATQDRETIEKMQDAVRDVRTALSTKEGRKLLDLLEKSTTGYFLPPSENSCALDALNAQRFIALDLRRIMSDETDALLSNKDDAEPSRRGRISRARDTSK